MSKRNHDRRSLEYEIDAEGLDEETEVPSTEPLAQNQVLKAIVKAGKLINFRSKPEMGGDENVIRTITGGTTMDVLSTDDGSGFLKVKIDGRVGFVASKFCEVK